MSAGPKSSADHRHTVTRTLKIGARFARIDNDVLQSKDLSFRARGVLAYVLSMPADWRHSAESLSSQSGEGLHAVRAALRELRNGGYARLETIRGAGGKIGSTWHFSESPSAEKPHSVKCSPGIEKPRSAPGVDLPNAVKPGFGKPDAGQPDAGQPDAGKPAPYITTIDQTTIDQTTIDQTTIDQTTILATAGAATGEVIKNEASSKIPKASTAPRDLIFEAIAKVDNVKLADLTTSGRGALNRARMEIVKAMPDVTPAEITRREYILKKMYPTATMSATSLAKHWARCGTMPLDPGSYAAAEVRRIEREAEAEAKAKADRETALNQNSFLNDLTNEVAAARAMP